MDDHQTELVCEIEYASMTKYGAYREPVFVRLRNGSGEINNIFPIPVIRQNSSTEIHLDIEKEF